MKRIIFFVLIVLLLVSTAFSVVSPLTSLKDDAETVRSYFSGSGVSESKAAAAYNRLYQEFFADSDEYLINRAKGKFHKPTCSGTKNMNEENKILITCSRQFLIDMGFEPCGSCHP